MKLAAGKRKTMAVPALLLALVLAACRPAGLELTPGITSLPTAFTTASPCMPTAMPSPTPTPQPTATRNPEDRFFTVHGEVVEISEDRTLFVYKSPTLSVRIERFNNPDIPLCWAAAEIRTRGEGFFTGYARNKEGSLEQPASIAKRYGTVFGLNTDFYTYHDQGIIIRQGELVRNVPHNDLLALYPDGRMVGYFQGSITAQELMAQGVENCFDFGPILVYNGEKTKNFARRSPVSGRNPRGAIGMVRPGYYVALLVDGRQPGVSVGASLDRLADMFLVYGCDVAYNMDGGQSAAMVFMGELVHSHDNDEMWPGMRRLPELLMIGTSPLVPKL